MKIVILDGAILNPGDVDWGPIEALGEVTVMMKPPKSNWRNGPKALDVRWRTNARAATMISILDSVRMVGVLATGYNTVDVEAFAERNIPVCNVVAYGVDDVAQHAMALLLELCRHTSQHTERVSSDWERAHNSVKHTPLCLAIDHGIVGFGSIGRRVGELAHAFGMSVLAHCRTPKNPPSYSPFAFASLDQLLAGSDVISLHCPLTPQTRNLINAKSLAKMRKGAILLNTARGPLVDEAAAAEALKSGQLRGLGTDVLSKEPPSRDNPLLSAPNTLITPHIAWATVKARQNIIDLTAENIRRWQEGTPVNVVNGVGKA